MGITETAQQWSCAVRKSLSRTRSIIATRVPSYNAANRDDGYNVDQYEQVAKDHDVGIKGVIETQVGASPKLVG